MQIKVAGAVLATVPPRPSVEVLMELAQVHRALVEADELAPTFDNRWRLWRQRHRDLLASNPRLEEPIMPRPSIGRIVVYNHPGSADGKFPPKQSPAMIQKVNDDGTLEIVVFSVYGGLFFNHNVEMGDGPSQCHWPVRVEE